MNTDNLLQDAFTQLAALREMLELTVKDENFKIDELQNIAERLNILSRSIEESANIDLSG